MSRSTRGSTSAAAAVAAVVTDVSVVTASVVAGVAPSADTVRVEASAVKVGPASSGDEDSSDSDEEAWRREGLVKYLERKVWPIACAVMPFVNSDPAVAARSALIPPPRMLRGNLAPHQRVGLTWLHTLHEHGHSGILADEMGLGKTVQTISLLATLLEAGDPGPHLIVAPVSVLENWRREVAQWCPEMRVLKYYGSEAEREEMLSDLAAAAEAEEEAEEAAKQAAAGGGQAAAAAGGGEGGEGGEGGDGGEAAARKKLSPHIILCALHPRRA